jgi:hypothetical protein
VDRAAHRTTVWAGRVRDGPPAAGPSVHQQMHIGGSGPTSPPLIVSNYHFSLAHFNFLIKNVIPFSSQKIYSTLFHHRDRVQIYYIH